MVVKDKLRKTSKREGSPDKPPTPTASREALVEDGSYDRRTAIVNDEILALRINHDVLSKIQEVAADTRPPPSSPVMREAIICRKNLQPLKTAAKTRSVIVAKLAPPEAELKEQDYMATSGARFDKEGNLIPHSILGTVEEYKREAIRRGDLPSSMLQPHVDTGRLSALSKHSEKSAKRRPSFDDLYETSALRNWRDKMAERKRQMGYLSNLLNMPKEKLVMNHSDTYRRTQEMRYLVDRTLHTVDYGKGYFNRAEFFKLQERIGTEEGGIQIRIAEVKNVTLSQTEMGYPPPIQHVSVPNNINKEKGIEWTTPRYGSNKPWHKSSFLKQRRKQLYKPMKELDPFLPHSSKLEIMGFGKRMVDSLTTDQPVTDEQEVSPPPPLPSDPEDTAEELIDPLKNYPDVYPAPVFGPSLLFDGKPVAWQATAAAVDADGDAPVAVEARIVFEALAAYRVTSHLEISNNGTTAIYYDWQKLPKTNPFDVMHAKVQRFYFNNSSGVILPADVMRFPFVFKSPNAGFFTEQWRLRTKPVLAGGAALMVTLRGVALQEDKYARQRFELERDLSHKQALEIVSKIISELVDGINSPPRPRSPIDSYITEEDLFHRRNPQLYYSRTVIRELKDVYAGLFDEDTDEHPEWNLDVNSIREVIVGKTSNGDEEEATKQDMLSLLNQHIVTLSFPPYSPIQQQMTTAAYEILCQLGDDIVKRSMLLRSLMGLSDRAAEDVVTDDSIKSIPATPDEMVVSVNNSKNISKALVEPPIISSDGRKSQGATSKKSDQQREGKKSAKEDKKSARQSPFKELAKAAKSGTPLPPRRSQEPPDEPKLPQSTTTSFEEVVIHDIATNPIQEVNYKEKMYIQVYQLVEDAVEKIGYAFEEIRLERPKKPDCQ